MFLERNVLMFVIVINMFWCPQSHAITMNALLTLIGKCGLGGGVFEQSYQAMLQCGSPSDRFLGRDPRGLLIRKLRKKGI